MVGTPESVICTQRISVESAEVSLNMASAVSLTLPLLRKTTDPGPVMVTEDNAP